MTNKEHSVHEELYDVGYMVDGDGRPYRLYLAPKSSELKCNWYDAVKYADGADISGYQDWVVPTSTELAEIFRILSPTHTEISLYKEHNKEAFVAGHYWSSTELSAADAWGQYVYNGNQNGSNKTFAVYVRLVRRVYVRDNKPEAPKSTHKVTEFCRTLLKSNINDNKQLITLILDKSDPDSHNYIGDDHMRNLPRIAEFILGINLKDVLSLL